MNKTERWMDRYKGIGYEIAKPESFPWAYYLYINLDKIEDADVGDSLWLESEKTGDGFPFYDYNTDFFQRLELHCGITFYSKSLVIARDKPENRIIKIGCDYGHIWDERSRYNEHSIEVEARNSIDILVSIIKFKE